MSIYRDLDCRLQFELMANKAKPIDSWLENLALYQHPPIQLRYLIILTFMAEKYHPKHYYNLIVIKVIC
jgi:hypothetical protein